MIKLNDLQNFNCPAWESIPDIELYMDQVLSLIDKHFSVFGYEGESSLTSSMINNYVKMKIVPPPAKKRYTREHIALFFMLTVLKRVLSIKSIGELFALLQKEMPTENVYRVFCRELNSAVDYIVCVKTGKKSVGSGSKELYGSSLALKCAIDSFANMILAEMIIEEELIIPSE